jgi:hypothetical protein
MVRRFSFFAVAPELTDDVAAYFREHAVPQFSACKGFLGYQCFQVVGTAKLLGISRWSSLEDLQASTIVATQVLAGARAIGAVTLGEPQLLEELFDACPTEIVDGQ